jgi:hypothetical protein
MTALEPLEPQYARCECLDASDTGRMEICATVRLPKLAEKPRAVPLDSRVT